MKTMLNVKIDSKLKKEAQKVVEEMGLSISAVVANSLRKLVEDREVVFKASYEPNKGTRKILDYALTEKAKREAVSFDSIKEEEKYLMNL